MGRELFKNLSLIDQQQFTALFDRWGYSHVACYRLHADKLVFVMGSDSPDEANWPATIDPVTLHYTDTRQDLLPFGWYKSKHKTGFGRKTIFYGPEQEDRLVKILFAVVPRDKRKREAGHLDGQFEALAKRLIHQIDQSESRQFFSESMLSEHASRLSHDTKILIDHEMRTPVSTIAGYGHLLAESSDPETKEAANVILEQVNSLLSSIEKLSSTIGAAFQTDSVDGEFGQVVVAELVAEVTQAVALHASSERQGKEIPKIRFVAEAQDKPLLAYGNRERLFRAMWEVVHNAVIYSLNSQVQVSLYGSGKSIIIDVKDNGIGVPKGSEDLIFLQFYKGQSDSKVKRGHRGLGLGLYLARYIIEQHAGQLLLVRQGEKGAVFRFLFPRFDASENEKAS